MKKNHHIPHTDKIRQPFKGRSAAAIIALTVFLLGFSAASLLSNAVASQAERDFKSNLEQRADSLSTYYLVRVRSYDRLLLASSSLLRMKEDPTADDWRQFAETMNLKEQYPGLLGLSYAPRLTNDQREQFIERTTKQKGGAYSITPDGSRDEYVPAVYVEPVNEMNNRALGFDLKSDPARRAALETARDTGKQTMTAPVVLKQDQGTDHANRLGVLIFYPIYRPGADLSTIENRRAAIKGYVSAVFRPNDILKSYEKDNMQATTHDLGVTMRDVTSAQPVNLYSIDNLPKTNQQIGTVEQKLEADGRQWQMSVSMRSAPLSRLYGPASIFLFGGVVSAVLGLLIYGILLNRLGRVQKVYEAEVQRTKDELLALASHQLRTPASGVKQYVGMLTSGIMGELTSTQLSIAQKAYDANERQIQIINELLYVSKADAGELLIEPSEMDLTKTVQDVVDSFAERAKSKEVHLIYTARKPRVIVADKRYLSMAIENLVSNAIKYTYHGTKVKITIEDRQDTLHLAIKDEGVGIPKDQIYRLFSKFDRIQNSLSYSEGGSGLGLFLARQLVLAHGGDITVQSEENKGSTFTIVLLKSKDIGSATVNIKR